MSRDLCATIARQLAQGLDRDAGERAAAPPQQRELGTNADGFWRTFDGHFANDIGSPGPQLTNRERLSTRGRVQSFGDAGADLANRIVRLEEYADIRHTADVRAVRPFLQGMSAEEHRNLFEVLEGRSLGNVTPKGVYAEQPGTRQVQPISPRVQRAIPIVQEYFQRRGEELEAKGIVPNFRVRRNYVPEMYETNALRSAKFKERAIEGIAEQQARAAGRTVVDAADRDTARMVMERYMGKQFALNAPNLWEMRTLDLADGRILDMNKVFALYAHQYWRTVGEAALFGPRLHPHQAPLAALELAEQAVASAQGKSLAQHTVDAYMRDTFGIYPSDPTLNSTAVRTLASMQTLKLSLSVIKNASQSLNTAMRTSFPTLMRSIFQYMRNAEASEGIAARDFAHMFASIADSAVYESTLFPTIVQDAAGRAGEFVLKYTGFTPVEKMNRVLAGFSGALYAQRQAERLVEGGSRAAEKRLLELGIDPARVRASNGELTLEQKLMAGQRVLNETQFRARVSELPFFANTPWARMLLMFRTFSINQTRLMWDQMSRRPTRMVAFGAGIMPVAGIGINLARQAFTQGLMGAPPPGGPPDDAYSTFFEGAASAGSFGYLADLLAYAYNNAGTGRSFFEPTMLSTLDDAVMVGHYIMNRKPAAAYRMFTRQFGGLGAAFGRVTAPPENR
jgi:hypothetical protein